MIKTNTELLNEVIEELNIIEKGRLDALQKNIKMGCEKCSQFDDILGCSKCEATISI